MQQLQDQIIQRQQKTLDSLQLDHVPKTLPPKAIPLKEKERETIKEHDECFDVQEIKVEGVEVLKRQEVDGEIKHYNNTCLSMEDIEELLRNITELYISRAYVTSQAYIKPQDLRDGVLEIKVVEGKIEQLMLNDHNLADIRKLSTAFPGLEGRVLNLRDIEQGIDQMNRLESQHAEIKILPGTKPGYSVVHIISQSEGSLRISHGVDNAGQQSTGHLRGTLLVEKDNLLNLNDYWSVNWVEDLEHERRFKRNKTIGLTTQIPYGKWSFGANTSISEYVSTFYGFGPPLKSSGRTVNQRAHLSRLLYRDHAHKVLASTGLSLKKTESYLGAIKQSAPSTRKLSLWDIGLNHIWVVGGGVLNHNMAYTRGIKLLGALKDEGLGKYQSHAQFNKFSGTLSYYRPFKLAKMPLGYQGNLHWQWSNESLFGSERMSIGDQYTIRGFKEESIQGDRGAYMRNELHYDVKIKDAKAKTYLKPQLYLALDAGGVRVRGGEKQNFGEGAGSLIGGGIGIRNNNKILQWDLAMTKAIFAPDFIDKKTEIYGTIGWKWRF